MTDAAPATLAHDVAEGDLLWTPDADRIDHASLTAFTRWLRDQCGVAITDEYGDLLRRSAAHSVWYASWVPSTSSSTTRSTSEWSWRASTDSTPAMKPA